MSIQVSSVWSNSNKMMPYSRPKLPYFFHLHLFKTLKKRGHAFQNIGNIKVYIPDSKISLASFAWKPYRSQGYIAVQPTKKEQTTVFHMFHCYRKSSTGNTSKVTTFNRMFPAYFRYQRGLQSMLGNSNFPNYFPQSGSHSQLSLSLRQNE